MKSGATYQFISGDEKKLKIEDNVIRFMKMSNTSVTITVKQTYKKKTTEIGKIKCNICLPKILQTEGEITLNRSEMLSYKFVEGHCTVVLSDYATPVYLSDSAGTESGEKYDESNAILRFVMTDETGTGEYNFWTGDIYGNREGTGYVHIYAGTVSEKSYIGTIKMNVVYKKTDSLKWGDNSSYFTEDENGEYIYTYRYSGEDTKQWLMYDYNPENTSDNPVITSSNQEVATIEEDDIFYFYDIKPQRLGSFNISIHKPGTTTFAVTLGDKTITKKVTFKAEESEY